MLDSGLALLQTGVEGPCVPVCSGHPQPSPGEVGTPRANTVNQVWRAPWRAPWQRYLWLLHFELSKVRALKFVFRKIPWQQCS